MINKKLLAFALLLNLIPAAEAGKQLPENFVYLKDIDPSIVQEMRYASDHNFIGRHIAGYEAAECILTLPAAEGLHKVQMELKKLSLSLKVYDCYRPQAAVSDFVAWSKEINQQQMKAEFYPRTNKADFFKLGYVAEKSGHTRGSTIDLTIIPLPAPHQPNYSPKQKLTACYAPLKQRFPDNSIDMGTGYDCMDVVSHIDDTSINPVALQHRKMFRAIMKKNNFVPYVNEWWHFTLKDEPFPNTYFNFPVTKK